MSMDPSASSLSQARTAALRRLVALHEADVTMQLRACSTRTEQLSIAPTLDPGHLKRACSLLKNTRIEQVAPSQDAARLIRMLHRCAGQPAGQRLLDELVLGRHLALRHEGAVSVDRDRELPCVRVVTNAGWTETDRCSARARLDQIHATHGTWVRVEMITELVSAPLVPGG